MSDFWSTWIIVLTTLTFIGTTWVLLGNRKGGGETENTTGHIYDGIEEFDNPLPAWWMWWFLLTIIFGVAYVIAYPGMGKYPGLLGWTSQNQWEAEVAEADEKYSAVFAKYSSTPVEELAVDSKALKIGRRIFSNNCAQCHGSDAGGSYSFPNLSDNAWLYGGSPKAIKTSITQGRMGTMPAWLAALGEEGVQEVGAFVMSLSGQDTDKTLAIAGEAKYQMFCFSCHGADGKGNTMFGAPDLTDQNWLYGSTAGDVQQSIRNGRNGRMPAHKDMLSEDKIHLLTAYVYSLSVVDDSLAGTQGDEH
jgi:cytochrome c oxidase cbb3-type subunit 3